MTRRAANVSVDLDGLRCYHAIHGLAEEADPLAVHGIALPRLLTLFERLGLRATLFAIGSDLERPEIRDLLREAAERGHEIASHSWSHAYDLRSGGAAAIAEDLDRCAGAIERATGASPLGFRAPGYNVDETILDLLEERGYRYDSSVFPCPAYWLAKGAVMAGMAVVGRPSRSAVTDPRALLAPRGPYRPRRGSFWRAGSRSDARRLVEVPMGVTRVTRFPVIGTTICALPTAASRILADRFGGSGETLQVELHGIDLLDAGDEGVSSALVARQGDLRRPWRAKEAALEAFLGRIAETHPFSTLAELTREF